MVEGELENVMVVFNVGEVDVMFCIMIVESGLDIFCVNMILIEDVYCFGLVQLY